MLWEGYWRCFIYILGSSRGLIKSYRKEIQPTMFQTQWPDKQLPVLVTLGAYLLLHGPGFIHIQGRLSAGDCWHQSKVGEQPNSRFLDMLWRPLFSSRSGPHIPHFFLHACREGRLCEVTGKDSCLQGRQREFLTVLVILSLLHKKLDKGNLREKGLTLADSFIIQSITVEKAWWWECGMAGYIVSIVRKKRVNASPQLTFSFLFSPRD